MDRGDVALSPESPAQFGRGDPRPQRGDRAGRNAAAAGRPPRSEALSSILAPSRGTMAVRPPPSQSIVCL